MDAACLNGQSALYNCILYCIQWGGMLYERTPVAELEWKREHAGVCWCMSVLRLVSMFVGRSHVEIAAQRVLYAWLSCKQFRSTV